MELHKGRVQLQGTTIVLMHGWRFIITSFSAQNTCHWEKLHKHRQHGKGIQDDNEVTITQSNFAIDEISSICKYEMKCRLLIVLVCFPKLYLQRTRQPYLNIIDVFSLAGSKILVDSFLPNISYSYSLSLMHKHTNTQHSLFSA